MIRFYRLMLTVIFLFIAQYSFSANVDTVVIHSTVMKKDIKSIIITPDQYASNDNFPVIYLLHGYSGNYRSWIDDFPNILQLSDQYQVVIVCPDGGFSSWYIDSPIDLSYKYETYISDEVVQWVDENYKTIKDSSGRAITGLSMGGYGALYLGIRHDSVFGAMGSMSGGVDLQPFPDRWEIKKRIGSIEEKSDNWYKYSVVNMVAKLKKENSIIIDCGTEDFFYEVNLDLHTRLLEADIAHDFISRPGGHTLSYWINAIEFQFLYFAHYFN